MMLETWGSVLTGSLQGVWMGFASFIPTLVVALIIVIVGWLVGSLLGKVVAQVVRSIKVDSALKSAGFDAVVSRAGFSLDSGAFLGSLVRWFFIVVFLVAAFDVLGLSQVNAFLQQVVLVYLPKVIVAVLVLLVAAVIADAVQKLVVATAKAAEVHSANFLGVIARYSIWIFALLVALEQLNIAVAFIQTLFTGVIVALALGFGLAYGLGGQDAAKASIEKLKSEIASHHRS
jgi:small-conductance mechanosensitive channel